MLTLVPVEEIPLISVGVNLAQILTEKLYPLFPLTSHDCLIVDSKVVAKARGRIENLGNDLTIDDIIQRESQRILRYRDGNYISETHHGFICENAGINATDAAGDSIVLLPTDIDSAAYGIRHHIKAHTNFDIPVIISGRFWRPFRRGYTHVALGSSGITPICATEQYTLSENESLSPPTAIIDEIASAAGIVMGQTAGICAVLARGLNSTIKGNGKTTDLITSTQEDLFR